VNPTPDSFVPVNPLDARLDTTDRLIANFNAIDPLGDLFRFGTSKQRAFGRAKSCDRVAYEQPRFFDEFKAASGCLSFWGAVLMREQITEEMGWSADPHFDAQNFPHRE